MNRNTSKSAYLPSRLDMAEVNAACLSFFVRAGLSEPLTIDDIDTHTLVQQQWRTGRKRSTNTTIKQVIRWSEGKYQEASVEMIEVRK